MVKDPKRKRADFKDKRMVDSGVWMGSDESGADSLLPSEDASTWGEDLLKDTKNSGASFFRPQGQPITQQRAAFRPSEESREHQLARAIVNDCLEKGQDSVDLR